MVTVGDEGSVSGWQQDEAFLSRDDTVQILIVIFVHWKKKKRVFEL